VVSGTGPIGRGRESWFPVRGKVHAMSNPGQQSLAARTGRRAPTASTGDGPGATAGTDRWGFPALAGRRGDRGERFTRALGLRHPVAIFVAALLTGLLALSAVSILLGLFVMHVLVGGLGLDAADNSVNEAMADHRTGTLTDLSWVGSQLGGAPLLPVLVGLIGLGFAVARRWRVAAFVVFALIVESATYRITTLFIHRDRPGVHRLENLPLDDSYPSGHTAASIAVYSGLVLLVTSRFTSSTSRALAWTVAILMTTFVALARMYRGMHHPLDVVGGVVVGIGAVLVLIFACRAAGAAAEARRQTRTRA
jgi:membrane-associated phospholipid phosphatase